MEVTVHVHVESTAQSRGAPAVTVSGSTVQFRAPDPLAACGFPLRELTLQAPSVTAGGPLAGTALPLADAIASGVAQRRNSVVYAYGTRLTSKRSFLVGTGASWQQSLVAATLSKLALTQHVVAFAYAMGDSDELKDLTNLSNEEGRIAETVREGPRVSGITRVHLRSAQETANFVAAVARNSETVFAKSTQPPQSEQELMVPAYVHESLVIGVLLYDSEATAQSGGSEMNSLHFIGLGDSQRPVLCGVDAVQLQSFERTQKTLAGAVGVLCAIKSSRLRVPFGKSRLTSLLKRAYNAEKGNPFNSGNAPTASYLVAHVIADDMFAEESVQTLTTARRVLTPGMASGSLTRDMSVDKWRLEQDIVELRDELAVAKAVFGYKPCIVEQAKPVLNIQDEEQKRVSDILRRREEQRNKVRAELDERTRAEAAKLIEAEERSSGTTLRELEDLVTRVRRENEQVEADRARKKQEHERYLEKVRKKREEEEQQEETLKADIGTLEEDIARKQDELTRKQRQLDLASQDLAKGREAILRERDELRAKRARQLDERRAQRRKWLEEIRQTNERMLNQVTTLRGLREQREAAGAPPIAEEAETEEMAREDIESINKYLPRLIALEDTPADVEQAESIRRQLEEYFAQEREAYTSRLEEEKVRLAGLEKQVSEYKGKLKDFQQSRRREMLAEAAKKDHHVQSLIDQIIQYLQHGVRMQKVSSNSAVRRRLFFISDDCKKIYACDLDDAGMPLNRRKPTTTVLVQDIKRVNVGIYSSSFTSYANKPVLKQQRDAAMRDNGTISVGTTPAVTPTTLGKYNYRSFALELRSGKTVELVCDTDSDCEAWLLALKRLLNYRTPAEKMQDVKRDRPAADTIGDLYWGEKLDLRERGGLDELYEEELNFCAENHIAPRHFLKTRTDLIAMSQNMIVTVYDVRKSSTLDLIRSQALLEYLNAKGTLASIS